MLDHYHRGVDGAVVLGVGLGLPYALLDLVDEAMGHLVGRAARLMIEFPKYLLGIQ